MRIAFSSTSILTNSMIHFHYVPIESGNIFFANHYRPRK
ncbi:MAG: hypothetical protein MjAS7_2701 [Metallosphaera javensis (ex Sakai et al. 2022)]|nr:MAG: hypothetical protein MjAS7_2701 [Metallosphaera javensis (ex Sakai et al. 2022)]